MMSSSQVKLCMVDSHLGETGVHVIVITVLEQERETELDPVLIQHLLVLGGINSENTYIFACVLWIANKKI